VLTASVLATVVGSVVLVPRNRRYKVIDEKEHLDANHDGVPDVFPDDSSKQ